ncbi:MAG: 4-hydroxy-tetrahydrodipicolinate reductase [Pseudomonadota bacterium]
MKPIPIVIIGGLGRLGCAILEAASNDKRVEIKGVVERSGAGKKWDKGRVKIVHDLSRIARKGDVLIDASTAEAVPGHLKKAVKLGTPYVLAATGIDTRGHREIERAARKICVVVAPNLSVGVAVLKELTELAASLLPEADIEIVETHHRNKMDAPSGTALSLAAAVIEGSGQNRDMILGRSKKGLRKPESIGIHAVRGGDIVGEHTVHLLWEGERIGLTHVAGTRAIFARGAIRAACFAAEAYPGIYTMRDILGLERMKV